MLMALVRGRHVDEFGTAGAGDTWSVGIGAVETDLMIALLLTFVDDYLTSEWSGSRSQYQSLALVNHPLLLKVMLG